MDIITSTQNKRIKYAKSLQTKARLRRSEMKLILEGNRLIKDALQRSARPDYVLYTPDRADYDIIATLQNRKCELLAVSDEVLNHVSDTQQAQGIIGIFFIPKPDLPPEPQRILIMDNIREPGNMGTILRTAGAAGVDLVILSPGCVDPYNSKVLRAGMGAHYQIPVVEATWKEIENFCAEIAIYSATADGELRYTDVDWTQSSAFIIGNEAHGISKNAKNIAQANISIPMASDTESLNAAIATAIILFEAQRQRLG
jgi:RNA methyltransferase, TrmH family